MWEYISTAWYGLLQIADLTAVKAGVLFGAFIGILAFCLLELGIPGSASYICMQVPSIRPLGCGGPSLEAPRLQGWGGHFVCL